MANKFARSNGDFNNPSIWSLLAGSMSATTVPTIGDNAIANTFTIQITGNVACDNITNGTTYGGTAGGTFNLGNGSQVTSNIIGHTSLITGCISVSGANSATLISSFISNGVSLSSNTSGQVNVVTDRVVGASLNNTSAIVNTSSGLVNITGNILGGGVGNVETVRNVSNGSIAVTGEITGATSTNAPAFNNVSTGFISLVGTTQGRTSEAIRNTSTGSVTVVGNVIGDSRGGSGIASTNPAANVRISGNLIGAPNGVPAVYAAAYTVNPVPSEAYIKHANNGTGVGSDAYLYYYTTDSLSAFSVPPASAVRAGVQYANNTLTGTCEIPPTSSVTFGVPVDTTTGTAVLTSNNLFDVSIASLTATDSLGARLRNSATVESVGRIIASFSN